MKVLGFLRSSPPLLENPKNRWRIAIALCLPLFIFSAAAFAKSGLPVPRFVSLGADKANLRNGPGKRYPIGWVFVRRGVPLQVIAEYEQWRKVRDADGAVGWIHRSLLSSQRSARVIGRQPRALLRRPDKNANVVARLEPGVIGRLLNCDGRWCRFEAGGQRGWIERAGLWGVFPKKP